MQILAESFDAARQGAAALRRQIIDTAQRNLNLGFDLAKGLAGASNLSEIVELQAAYWRKQFDAFTTPADEVRHLLEFNAPKLETVESSPQRIYPELAKKAPPRAQEAPKKRHSPAAQDSAAKGLRRDAQEPPAAGSTVRPPADTQTGIRRKGGAGDEPKKMQRPTARASAAEGGKRKLRPSSGLVAPPGVRPPDERQSGTPKKGAPQEEAFPQSLPAEIKFGMLDGNAVRFTSLEAWWLVDGVWRPISPDEVLLNAAVMREAQFNQVFPEVPQLPRKAFKADNLQN